MKKSEMIRLEALVRKFRRESDRLAKKSIKIYKTAGFDADIIDGKSVEGTGDEGWAACHRVMGESSGYEGAASEMCKLLRQLKVEK